MVQKSAGTEILNFDSQSLTISGGFNVSKLSIFKYYLNFAREMGKIKISYSFVEYKDIFFLLGLNPLILMLLFKLSKQKGKMKGKISNMKM